MQASLVIFVFVSLIALNTATLSCDNPCGSVDFGAYFSLKFGSVALLSSGSSALFTNIAAIGSTQIDMKATKIACSTSCPSINFNSQNDGAVFVIQTDGSYTLRFEFLNHTDGSAVSLSTSFLIVDIDGSGSSYESVTFNISQLRSYSTDVNTTLALNATNGFLEIKGTTSSQLGDPVTAVQVDFADRTFIDMQYTRNGIGALLEVVAENSTSFWHAGSVQCVIMKQCSTMAKYYSISPSQVIAGNKTTYRVSGFNATGAAVPYSWNLQSIQMFGDTGSTYLVDVSYSSIGQYVFNFTLNNSEGVRIWALDQNKQPLFNYPLTISVYPSALSTAKSTIEGRGMIGGLVSQPSSFIVTPRDSQGNPFTDGSGCGTIGVTISPSGSSIVSVTHIGGGQCEVIYISPTTGSKTMAVTIGGQPMAASPFTIQIVSGYGPIDGSKCFILSKDKASTGSVGTNWEALMQGVDVNGQYLTTSSSSAIVMTATGSLSSGGLGLNIDIRDLGNGKYRLNTSFPIAGTYSISVSVGGINIPGPLSVIVTGNGNPPIAFDSKPSNVAPGNISLLFSPVPIGESIIKNNWLIIIIDALGNVVDSTLDSYNTIMLRCRFFFSRVGTFKVIAVRLSGDIREYDLGDIATQVEFSVIPSNLTAALNQRIDIWAFPKGVGNWWDARVNTSWSLCQVILSSPDGSFRLNLPVNYNGDGSYSVVANLTVAGFWRLYIADCGASRISPLPQVLQVVPIYPILADNVVFSGPGAVGGYVNTLLTIVVSPQDVFGNLLGCNASSIVVTIQSPSGATVPAMITNPSDMTCNVIYSCSLTGFHAISFAYGGQRRSGTLQPLIKYQPENNVQMAAGYFAVNASSLLVSALDLWMVDIQLTDSNGIWLSSASGISISVNVSMDAPYAAPYLANSSESAQGKMQVRFQFPSFGNYLVFGSVQGRPLKNSPLRITVNPAASMKMMTISPVVLPWPTGSGHFTVLALDPRTQKPVSILKWDNAALLLENAQRFMFPISLKMSPLGMSRYSLDYALPPQFLASNESYSVILALEAPDGSMAESKIYALVPPQNQVASVLPDVSSLAQSNPLGLKLSSNLASVALTFSVATDRAKKTGTFPCSSILITFFGNGTLKSDASECVWSSDTELIMTFAATSNILPGDYISLKNNTIGTLNTTSQSYFFGSVSIILPDAAIPAFARITAPQQIGPCDDLVLDASASLGSGGRPFSFLWSLLSSPLANSLALSTALTQLPSNASRILIPRNLLSTVGNYTFSLTVSNWMGSYDVAIWSTIRLGGDAPLLLVPGPVVTLGSTLSSLVLDANIRFGGCMANTAGKVDALQYFWYQVSGPAVILDSSSRTSSNLYFGPGVFTPGVQYGFTINATVLSQNVSSNASATVLVQAMPMTDVKVSIAGGSFQTVSRLVNNRFKASLSTLSGQLVEFKTSSLTYVWICDPSPCFVVGAVINSTSSDLLVPAGSLLPGVKTLGVVVIGGSTVGFSLSSRQDSATINVTDSVNGTIFISAHKEAAFTSISNHRLVLHGEYLLPLSRSPSCSTPILQWNALEGDVNLTMADVGQPYLVLNTGQMYFGQKYTLSFSVQCESGISGIAETDFSLGNRPHSGSFVVQPLSGNAISTKFSMEALSWVDDIENLPLSYGFAVTDKNLPVSDAATWVTVVQLANRWNWRLQSALPLLRNSSGYFSISVAVTNTVGAAITSNVPIYLRPWENSTVSTSSWTDLLLNQVLADDFEVEASIAVTQVAYLSAQLPVVNGTSGAILSTVAQALSLLETLTTASSTPWSASMHMCALSLITQQTMPPNLMQISLSLFSVLSQRIDTFSFQSWTCYSKVLDAVMQSPANNSNNSIFALPTAITAAAFLSDAAGSLLYPGEPAVVLTSAVATVTCQRFTTDVASSDGFQFVSAACSSNVSCPVLTFPSYDTAWQLLSNSTNSVQTSISVYSVPGASLPLVTVIVDVAGLAGQILASDSQNHNPVVVALPSPRPANFTAPPQLRSLKSSGWDAYYSPGSCQRWDSVAAAWKRGNGCIVYNRFGTDGEAFSCICYGTTMSLLALSASITRDSQPLILPLGSFRPSLVVSVVDSNGCFPSLFFIICIPIMWFFAVLTVFMAWRVDVSCMNSLELEVGHFGDNKPHNQIPCHAKPRVYSSSLSYAAGYILEHHQLTGIFSRHVSSWFTLPQRVVCFWIHVYVSLAIIVMVYFLSNIKMSHGAAFLWGMLLSAILCALHEAVKTMFCIRPHSSLYKKNSDIEDFKSFAPIASTLTMRKPVLEPTTFAISPGSSFKGIELASPPPSQRGLFHPDPHSIFTKSQRIMKQQVSEQEEKKLTLEQMENLVVLQLQLQQCELEHNRIQLIANDLDPQEEATNVGTATRTGLKKLEDQMSSVRKQIGDTLDTVTTSVTKDVEEDLFVSHFGLPSPIQSPVLSNNSSFSGIIRTREEAPGGLNMSATSSASPSFTRTVSISSKQRGELVDVAILEPSSPIDRKTLLQGTIEGLYYCWDQNTFLPWYFMVISWMLAWLILLWCVACFLIFGLQICPETIERVVVCWVGCFAAQQLGLQPFWHGIAAYLKSEHSVGKSW